MIKVTNTTPEEHHYNGTMEGLIILHFSPLYLITSCVFFN